MTAQFATAFSQHWVAAWNNHDLDLILQDYAEDVCIESRIAKLLVPASQGIIKGKVILHQYWAIGLSRNKNLKFKILDVLFGINGLTIYYVNTSNNLRAAETLIFNAENKVEKVIVHHSA